MAELNYKASNIAKAEREYNLKFFGVLADIMSAQVGDNVDPSKVSFSSLLFMLAAGGLSEDEASDIVDIQGLDIAMQAIADGLLDSGFLAKMKDKPEVKAQLARLQKEASPSTGATTKA